MKAQLGAELSPLLLSSCPGKNARGWGAALKSRGRALLVGREEEQRSRGAEEQRASSSTPNTRTGTTRQKQAMLELLFPEFPFSYLAARSPQRWLMRPGRNNWEIFVGTCG